MEVFYILYKLNQDEILKDKPNQYDCQFN